MNWSAELVNVSWCGSALLMILYGSGILGDFVRAKGIGALLMIDREEESCGDRRE